MKKDVALQDGRTLGDVATASRVRIARLAGIESENMRLISLGLRKGVEIEMKNNSGKGPVVVAFGNCRLALGRALARKIRVV